MTVNTFVPMVQPVTSPAITENLHVCRLFPTDPRYQDYQRLRADVFSLQLGWSVFVDAQGLERDTYDLLQCVTTYGVYAHESDASETLLGGIRLLVLRDWYDSMIPREFAYMFPEAVIKTLTSYPAQDIVEITRLCSRPKNQCQGCNVRLARNLVLAGAFACAEQTQRYLAVGIASAAYLRIARKSLFVFETLYSTVEYALILIDLKATIQRIQQADDTERLSALLFLSRNPELWLS